MVLCNTHIQELCTYSIVSLELSHEQKVLLISSLKVLSSFGYTEKEEHPSFCDLILLSYVAML